MWRSAAPLLLLLSAAAPPKAAFGPPAPPTPYDLCEAAVASARTKIIPPTLLPAIARVESGRLDPAFSRYRPWPWSINVEGVGSFYDSKEDAIAAVQAFQAKGIRSIDVGCMQVNLMFHPDAFPNLQDAFDPAANTAYAVRFLTSLYAQAKDWNLAAAYYHSQTQELGEDYQRRLFGRVMTPMGPSTSKEPRVYGAFLPPALQYSAIPPQSQAFAAFAPVSAQPVFGLVIPPQATARR